MTSYKNYKERVTISRIKSHSKFTEKMTIYDYYITELNNRQKMERTSIRAAFSINLPGTHVPGRTGVNLIKLLHVYFTSVAIVLKSENNSCTCKLHV